MPIYTFLCDEEANGCNERFEKSLSMKEFDEKVPTKKITCPNCKKRKPVITQIDIPLHVTMAGRTVGAVADRNSTRLSKDEQHHLHKKHTTYDNPDLKLPDGMTQGKDMV